MPRDASHADRALAALERDPLSILSRERDAERLAELRALRDRAAEIGLQVARRRLESRGYSPEGLAKRLRADPTIGLDALADMTGARLHEVVAALFVDPYLCRRVLLTEALLQCPTCTHREIARAFGCDVVAVSRAARAAGVDRYAWQRHAARQRELRIVSAYAAGASPDQIAEAAGISLDRVLTIVAKRRRAPHRPIPWSEMPPIPREVKPPPRPRLGGARIHPLPHDLVRLQEIRDEWEATGQLTGPARRRAVLRAVAECPSISFRWIGHLLGVGTSAVATAASRHGVHRTQPREGIGAVIAAVQASPHSAMSMQAERERLAALAQRTQGQPKRQRVLVAVQECPRCTQAEIADALGMSRPAVSRILTGAGHNTLRDRGEALVQMYAEMADAFARGLTVPEIAALYGRSHSTVRQAIAAQQKR